MRILRREYHFTGELEGVIWLPDGKATKGFELMFSSDGLGGTLAYPGLKEALRIISLDTDFQECWITHCAVEIALYYGNGKRVSKWFDLKVGQMGRVS